MREVTSPTFNHATSCVQVDPKQEAKVWPFEVITDGFVIENVHQFIHSEDGLANGLNEAVLTLKE